MRSSVVVSSFVVMASVAAPLVVAKSANAHPNADNSQAEPRTLNFDDRVEAQRAIEEVYWRHRIWPEDNSKPKPPLSEVMSDSALRAKVEDYARKSNAMEVIWGRPITPAQLQAEIDRMATGSRARGTLGDLFAALDNDPQLVAETLARQALVERLIRSWYARDERFHANSRRKAEVALSRVSDPVELYDVADKFEEVTWQFAPREESLQARRATEVVIEDAAQWRAQVESLASKFDRVVGAVEGDAERLMAQLPLQRRSRLWETDDAFSVLVVLEKEPGFVRTVTFSWNKQQFDEWWVRAKNIDADLPEPGTEFSIPALDGTCVPNSWQYTQGSNFPEGRWNHTAVWTGVEMIVWGGAYAWNTGGRYNPATDTWTPTSNGTNVPTPRTHHTAIWTGTEMIVWGGSSPTVNTGGRYNPATDSWQQTSTGSNVPSPRELHSAVWTGTEMIVWGGTDDTSGGRYDPSKDTWQPTSTDANTPAARDSHTAIWTGSQMIVWGGLTSSNVGGRYDPFTDSWSPMSTSPSVPAPWYGHTAIWTGSQMIVWGGVVVGDPTNRGGRYDPATDVWQPTSTGANTPVSRRYHSAVWSGKWMVVWGGYNSSSPYGTGGRYDPVANVWQPTSTGGNVPSARYGHSAVWTGSECIVWGGISTVLEDTGGRYNPTIDSWIPTATATGVPPRRSDNSTVWTGAEMIVWGGRGLNDNTGGRYDPATDNWSPTSTSANVPSGRDQHTAVWTGLEMIVWGGGSPTNTGGRYYPATDSWLPTSTGANVPVARRLHGAAWTGSQMIVWGGVITGSGTAMNSGGRYDPGTDSWQPTSVGANVPLGRFDHLVVWSPGTMIVWGGSSSGNRLNSGGRYHPSTDTWEPTTLAGAPFSRNGFAGVAANGKMIVWGGFTNGGMTNTGGRYDPGTNSWQPTSIGPGVPTARIRHSAIWTGGEMIVWGGIGNENSMTLNSGGIYNPLSDSWHETSMEGNIPPARYGHSAVFADPEMIIWGGGFGDGGRYCTCDASPWYEDLDGDGYGSEVGVSSCEAVPDYVPVGGDCNDSNANVWSIPPEVTGLNLDRPVAGMLRLSWTPTPASSSAIYHVIRGPLSTLTVGFLFVDSCTAIDAQVPQYEAPADACSDEIGCWFLVRATNSCGYGTFGIPVLDEIRDCP